jgi:16S rRNA G966 N2-methylase RsmD
LIIALSLPPIRDKRTLEEDKTISFILEHAEAEGTQLLLSASRYPGVDMTRAASAIEARKKIAYKIPLWYTYTELIYPTSLSVEQCSSQATAEYKMRFVPEDGTIADLTGGLGVDCSFMARRATKCLYMERDPMLCEAAQHNFKVLGLDNTSIINGDCREYLHRFAEENEEFSKANERDKAHFDLIYLDPARRSKDSGRLFSIRECEPDLMQLSGSLLKAANRVLVKLSPMVDITATLREIPCVREVHILSTDNECKEVLLLMSSCGAPLSAEDIPIHAVDITHAREKRFTFTINEERVADCPFSAPETYLHQLGRAILKAGAFKFPCTLFGISKIATSTHLYTSDTPVEGFPGKSFRIERIIPFNKEGIRIISREYLLINCVSLNFPIDTNALKQRLKIRDGGNLHLFATTLASGEKVMIVSEPLSATF